MRALIRSWLWVPSLYFCEGLPYVLVMTVSTILYKSMGVSNTDITFFTAWLYLPWVIKPLWSPIVDILSTKRRWIVTMQLLLAVALGSVAFSLTTSAFFGVSLAAFWFVAFLSATQDIAIDGFYILGLDDKSQAFFVGIRTLFYRLATIAGQGALVVGVGILEQSHGVANAWRYCFTALALLFALFAVYHLCILPHPSADTPKPVKIGNVLAEFGESFASFFRKPYVMTALRFMLFYRFAEAMLIKMILPFMLDDTANGGLGLTIEEVGSIYGAVGAVGLIVGGVIGGWVISRGGLKRWIMPMAWSMSLTCLTFVYLAYVPQQSLPVVYACVFIEQFGYGFGGTAYMMYLIHYARGSHATSHYAIATGFMALGMMIPGMFAGAVQESMGYRFFFSVTCLACLLTILVAAEAKIHLRNSQ